MAVFQRLIQQKFPRIGWIFASTAAYRLLAILSRVTAAAGLFPACASRGPTSTRAEGRRARLDLIYALRQAHARWSIGGGSCFLRPTPWCRVCSALVIKMQTAGLAFDGGPSSPHASPAGEGYKDAVKRSFFKSCGTRGRAPEVASGHHRRRGGRWGGADRHGTDNFRHALTAISSRRKEFRRAKSGAAARARRHRRLADYFRPSGYVLQGHVVQRARHSRRGACGAGQLGPSWPNTGGGKHDRTNDCGQGYGKPGEESAGLNGWRGVVAPTLQGRIRAAIAAAEFYVPQRTEGDFACRCS